MPMQKPFPSRSNFPSKAQPNEMKLKIIFPSKIQLLVFLHQKRIERREKKILCKIIPKYSFAGSFLLEVGTQSSLNRLKMQNNNNNKQLTLTVNLFIFSYQI